MTSLMRSSLQALKWLGTVAGIAGALLIALNVGGTIVGIGFMFFAVSATAWASSTTARSPVRNEPPRLRWNPGSA